MKNKGQMNLGVIITTAIAIIVGVILFQVVAQQAGESTTLITLSNHSIGTVTNGTDVYLTDYRALSDVVVTNYTGLAILHANNYTITNNVIDPTTGGLSVRVATLMDADTEAGWSATELHINATAQPTTYIDDGGSRSVVGLIAIFFALAIVVIALEPTLRGGALELMGR